MTSEDMQIGERAVIVVGKPARRGKVKTRLAESVGDQVATDIYRRFLADIAGLVARFRDESDARTTPVLAWKDDLHHDSYTPFKRAGFQVVEQPAGDLGVCMSGLSGLAMESGADQVLIVGTDSPTLHPRHLRSAFGCLEDGADVVFGPSFDGGYYLVGLSGAHDAVFRNIHWSTGAVLEQSLKRAREAQLLCELTEFWYDVDTLGDLKRMRAHLFEFLKFRHPKLAAETRMFLETLPDRMLVE